MNPKEYEALLDEAENRLERLRVLYEQWFQGFERIEPSVPRKEVERRMQSLRRAKPHNTALRFRFQTLWQRYTTFQTYWGRISRQIEEGTYRRDLMKARKRRQARQQEFSSRRRKAPEIDIEVDLDELDADKEVEAALAALQPGSQSASEAQQGAAPAAPAASGEQSGATPAPKSPPSTPAGAPARQGSISPFAMTPSKRPAAQSGDGGPVRATFGKPKDPASAASAKGDASSGASKPTPGSAQRPPTPQGQRPPTPGAGRPPTPGPRPPASGAKPPPTPGQRPPTPGARASGASRKEGIEEARMRRIYEQYVQARKRNNERTDNVSYEGLKRSVDKMAPKLREKHKGKNIDFEVVVRNGKVGLKPKSE